MNFHSLVEDVISDTLSSLPLFGPEIAICITIFVLLATRVLPVLDRIDAYYLTLLGLVVALLLPDGGQPWRMWSESVDIGRTEIFTGMLVYDGFTLFMRGVLLVFGILLLLLMRITHVLDRRDGTDVYTLILGATLGMCLMASANHLLMVFLAVEMASVPSYILAGMRKTRRLSSEAALKYSVYGAGTAGIMLYGISLVAGVTNSVHLPTMATRLAMMWPEMGVEQSYVLALGGLMIMVGLAFKLSAVPFHFWCPDVFEGASAEVNAFLSVASKAAALALLVRVAIGFGVIPPSERDDNAAMIQADHSHAAVSYVAHTPKKNSRVAQVVFQPAASSAVAGPASLRGFIAVLIAVVAAVTCTFGNLAAYGQTNINRLLAYSTIAHAGYMMMPVPAAIAMVEKNPESAEIAMASLGVYIAIYLFMNLGAFAIVALLRDALGSEEIADYGGLIRRLPGTVICFSIILFSLVGLPPLAGFIGKFAVFSALVAGYQVTQHGYLIALLFVGGINTVISLFYYLRVVKVMTIEAEPDNRRPIDFSMISVAGAYVVLVTSPMLLFFLKWDWLSKFSRSAVDHLFS